MEGHMLKNLLINLPKNWHDNVLQNVELILAKSKENSFEAIKIVFRISALQMLCFSNNQRNNLVSGIWYDNQVVGFNLLAQMIKVISQNTNLSMIYMNHIIRSILSMTTDQTGLEACDIMAVSWQRSDKSIQN